MNEANSDDASPNPADPAEEFERWILKARSGDRDALGRLIEDCRTYLLQIANREMPGDLRAKVAPSDLVQETCLEAHQNFFEFQGAKRDELLAWLRRILIYNLSNASRRYRDTAKRRLGRELSLDDGVSTSELRAQLASKEQSPSQEAIQREEQAIMEAAIVRLPADFRQAVLLRHREHLSFAEIGQRLNRSTEAARKLWERAVERLAQEMKLTDDDESR